MASLRDSDRTIIGDFGANANKKFEIALEITLPARKNSMGPEAGLQALAMRAPSAAHQT
jgi:hypothetical protein